MSRKRNGGYGASGKHYRAARRFHGDEEYCGYPFLFLKKKFIATAILLYIIAFVKGVVWGYLFRGEK
jgi:hypothetical protein